MRKFVFRLGLFIGLLIVIVLGVNSFQKGGLSSNHYLRGFKIKHMRLQSISTPRLILVGGSNLAFGVDSRVLSERLGMPVVNLGLNAGLGLDFLLSEVKSVMRKKDVVVLSVEYLLDEGNEIVKKKMISAFPETKSFYNFSVKDYVEYELLKTKRICETLIGQNKFQQKEQVPYTKDSFTSFGEIRSELREESKEDLKAIQLDYRFWEGIEKLNDFKHFCDLKGIDVYFTYPTFSHSGFMKNEKIIKKASEDISKNLSIDVICSPEYFVYSDTLFYDTDYHLNASGVMVRSNDMVELLKKHLLYN